jgi:tRNA dimethylallyltransferase
VASPKLPLLIIAGPTGSGKSALAIALARIFKGEIVNCDSLQLYRGFDIGAAKTPVAARHGIPHHLFDVLEPRNGYSAGEYARAARAVLAEISGRGRLPIIVGGTGFYLRALLDGLPSLPERDQAQRARLAAKEARKPGTLHR